MYFSRFLGLPEGYWAAITAMIVLQASLGAALKESWVRVAATATGAAVAMPFVAFFGQSLPVFGVAVFVTVILCLALRLQAGLRVAATTVAIIMLTSQKKPKILDVLTAHAERIVRALDALDVATEGVIKGELPLKLDPELAELSAGVKSEGSWPNSFRKGKSIYREP